MTRGKNSKCKHLENLKCTHHVENTSDPINPCPICLANEDDHGAHVFCSECGQLFCGECKDKLCKGQGKCPTCRAPFRMTKKEAFDRVYSLVHVRSDGRHTPVAQHSVGCMYEFGQGIQRDIAMAVEYYNLAANRGYVNAQYNLGLMYKHGRGVKQDDAMAFKYFTMTAERNDPQGQCSLGIMYGQGRGVKRDSSMALKYYKLAAKQGDAQAFKNLSSVFAIGQRVQIEGSSEPDSDLELCAPLEGAVVKLLANGRALVMVDDQKNPRPISYFNLTLK
eukprot:m.272335 g.272335  ORF g.272335 m.272335 type:complete len:278 (-) comp100737_c0_seq1:2-835(-)